MTILSLRECRICPRNCGVDRSSSVGFCGAGELIRINLAQIHRGEEPQISGSRGSGTIFFSHCNLKCVFCQNHEISVDGWGKDHSPEECAEIMLQLQDQGVHNINLVTPTHYSLQLLESLTIAKNNGLSIPVVWNSNAYENVETLQLLEGLVDIYLPDCKYAHGVYARKYSHASDYPGVALKAIEEMYRQVGDLEIDSEGIATRGLMIRLLVLPNGLAGISSSLDRIAERLGAQVRISLMAQYYPTHKAREYPELSRGITQKEYDVAVEAAISRGFSHVLVQELSCSSEWTPDFVDYPRESLNRNDHHENIR